jgi:hypothetical protein
MPRGSSTASNKQRADKSKSLPKSPVDEDGPQGSGDHFPSRTDSQSSQSSLYSQSTRFKKLSFRPSGLEPSTSRDSVLTYSTTGVPYESISPVSKSPIAVTYLPPNANNGNGPVRSSSVSSDSTFLPPNLISGPIPPLPQRSYGVASSGSVTPTTATSMSASTSSSSISHVQVSRGNSGHQSHMAHINATSHGSGHNSSHHSHSTLPPLPHERDGGNRQTSHGSGKSVKSAYEPMMPTQSRQSSGYSEDDNASIYAPSLFSLKTNISAMAHANEFNLEKPEDDDTIEAMFLDLMVSVSPAFFFTYGP